MPSDLVIASATLVSSTVIRPAELCRLTSAGDVPVGANALNCQGRWTRTCPRFPPPPLPPLPPPRGLDGPERRIAFQSFSKRPPSLRGDAPKPSMPPVGTSLPPLVIRSAET